MKRVKDDLTVDQKKAMGCPCCFCNELITRSDVEKMEFRCSTTKRKTVIAWHNRCFVTK